MYIHIITDTDGVEIHREQVTDARAADVLDASDIWHLQIRELPNGDYTWREGADGITHTLVLVK